MNFACDECQDVGFIYSGPPPFLSSQAPEHLQKCACNIADRVDCKGSWKRYSGPIHTHFGLSYCSYFTVPRIALQGMPIWWQKLFVWLMRMLPENLPEYSVQRRNKRGRFITDPWANYRRGDLDELLKEKND